MILTTCPRCRAETPGTREGSTEYCTSCGGVLGASFTAERRYDKCPEPGCTNGVVFGPESDWDCPRCGGKGVVEEE